MMLPELRYSKEVSENYSFSVPRLGFMVLAEAVELDISKLDSFTVTLLSEQPINSGRRCHARYIYNQLYYDDGSRKYTGNVEVFLRSFVGYGELGLSLHAIPTNNLDAAQIENLNFSGTLLHELMHAARIERLRAGAKVPYLPRAHHVNRFGGQYLFDKFKDGEEERYVQFHTHELLMNNPALRSAIQIAKR